MCDDSFSDTDATVICKEMNYIGSKSWKNFNGWDTLQSSYDIVLDDINCEDANQRFGNCNYTRSHNCGHTEDVFLNCKSKHLSDAISITSI